MVCIYLAMLYVVLSQSETIGRRGGILAGTVHVVLWILGKSKLSGGVVGPDRIESCAVLL